MDTFLFPRLATKGRVLSLRRDFNDSKMASVRQKPRRKVFVVSVSPSQCHRIGVTER